jgi:tRNA-2-methylthio-N6-dimethylallyladenosine synthase
MAQEGYERTDEPQKADLIVLNTCHIREKAAEKIYSELGRMRLAKEKRAARGLRSCVVVAGCVAQAEGEEILRRAPVVDIVIGPQSYHNLPRLARKALSEGARLVETEFPRESKFDHLPARKPQRISAFLTVQEGCDKFCSFCVVPYTRGAEYSRPLGDILREARELQGDGVREITLLGQNVNAWRGESENGSPIGLAGLIDALGELEGIERLRYTTSHPLDMDDELIALHARSPRLMPYLHLPVQSGSDKILKAMNRGHTADEYLRLVDKIRQSRPDIALSTDIIVGFPGESEDDFALLLDWLEEAELTRVGCFTYENVKGAPANDLPGHLPEKVKRERYERLMETQRDISARILARRIGREMEIIIDEADEKGAIARSAWDAPEVDGNVFIDAGEETEKLRQGDIVKARIIDANDYDMWASPNYS